MMKLADLPDKIPVFPLPGALLLPRARLPLHIFEPRYLAMLDDTLKTPHRLIGMVQPNPLCTGKEKQLHAIGCAGRITQFSETEDGRYMVTLAGISRYRITREVEGFTPYRCCEVSWASFERDLDQTPEKDTDFCRTSFFDLLRRYFDVHDLQTDWDSMKDAENEMLIDALSMLCPLEPEDKQALLEAPSLSTRRETLVTLIEFALRGGDEEMIKQ
ncbi:LON peptidase substrate-binding domain-containing protein [Poseidonocella sedimentorum]|uniref:Lon N-terminal domain-containing protein n=1 Tax=Poseidonocella sedimentorum TaxID=871652 RepID=A0A1I6D7Z9_9RHOB|nr:LON peptidase substrate-binding domain-containing protein [Poseidonocella sedimentorum]SFR01596.1 hypothetical protein SAMN04515673_102386 [Poseidonocella sedimentorum]